jgi:hypothetical protein
VLLALAFAVLTGVIEAIARALAPPPERDPRLGYLAFWLTVAVVALATPVLAVAIERTGALLERILFGLWIVAWLAWKAGIADHPDAPPDSQRDHVRIPVIVSSESGDREHRLRGRRREATIV